MTTEYWGQVSYVSLVEEVTPYFSVPALVKDSMNLYMTDMGEIVTKDKLNYNVSVGSTIKTV